MGDVVELSQVPVDEVAEFWRAITFICRKSDLAIMDKIGILEVVKAELVRGTLEGFDSVGIERL